MSATPRGLLRERPRGLGAGCSVRNNWRQPAPRTRADPQFSSKGFLHVLVAAVNIHYHARLFRLRLLGGLFLAGQFLPYLRIFKVGLDGGPSTARTGQAFAERRVQGFGGEGFGARALRAIEREHRTRSEEQTSE